MKKILIVEDEVAIAADLQDIIEDHDYKVVGLAFTYERAINLIADKQPDLVMLDISLLGDKTGLDVAKELKTKYKIPFIFLTSYTDDQTVQQAVNLEPLGYLVKPFKEEDIAPAISLALALRSKRTTTVFPDIDTLNYNLASPLTSQEYNVIHEIWKNKRNADIASALSVSINTIKTHVQNIYLKLDVNNRTALLRKVMT